MLKKFHLIILIFLFQYSFAKDGHLCRKLFQEDFLKDEPDNDANKFQEWPEDAPNFLVNIEWFNNDAKHWDKRVGTILTEYIIITADVPGVSINKGRGGFCLLTFSVDPPNVRRWRNWRSSAYVHKEFEITLIKLDVKLNLGSDLCSLNVYPGKYPPPDSMETKAYKFGLTEDKALYTALRIYDESEIKDSYQFYEMLNDWKGAKTDVCKEIGNFRGSPIVYERQLVGLYRDEKKCKTTKIVSLNINYKKQWIQNAIADLMNEKYSWLCKFVVLYGKKIDGIIHIQGIAVILDENFLITNNVKATNINGVIIPEVDNILNGSTIAGSIKIERSYFFARPPYNRKSIQLAIMKVKTSMPLNAKKPAHRSKTKYPIAGSRCYVITALNKDTDHPDFTWESNIHFTSDEVKLIEIAIDIWTYTECKDYIRDLDKRQFCFRIHGGIDEGNHCKYIMNGSPIFCNSRLTGIVNELNSCKQHEPRVCTNIYEMRKWIDSKVLEKEPIKARDTFQAIEEGRRGHATRSRPLKKGGGKKCNFSLLKLFFALLNSIGA
uniref:Peptidase S1 domain-containing protein n=1 Tax=Glossina pallidipes TaxID=7398 RepID=A0A1A9ZE85_GLOPL